ncbi:hypothetical protein Misp06_00790 [Microbulbifer sp. NBRC 101763]|uniref:DUF4062 domain-containing protein n=1 Tax=Microbulbifer sp. NBRC 101763 TaxID=1113820 RepID=UPI0030B7B969
MSNKYQIFVSSTYKDLKEHRDQVIKAVLEMGHIPVGMEMFSAADEGQWSIIKRQIDQSDYYVVILANRYGSVTDEGLSYTEKEYDYAVSKGIPILGFVLDDEALWPSQHTDTVPKEVSSLKEFKIKVKQKHVSFWKNTDDLYGKCSIALMKAFTSDPREGWVRASEATNIKMANELTRLSAENSELRKQIKNIETDAKEKRSRENNKIINILLKNERPVPVRLCEGDYVEEACKINLFRLFNYLAPEMLIEKSVNDISTYVAVVIANFEASELYMPYPIPRNIVKDWIADLSALELVSPSSKKKPITDMEEYWALSERGKEILNILRRMMLEETDSSLSDIKPGVEKTLS